MKTTQDSKIRTVIKSAVYILTHETLIFFISWMITGSPAQSLAIMALASAAEMVYYYLYERLWSRIKISLDRKKESR